MLTDINILIFVIKKYIVKVIFQRVEIFIPLNIDIESIKRLNIIKHGAGVWLEDLKFAIC